jgi:hypothetical protein
MQPYGTVFAFITFHAKCDKKNDMMKNHMYYDRYGRQLSAFVRLVLIAAVCTGAGWSGFAWGVDEGWPRQKQQDGNTLVYYQPQLDSWKDQTVLKARIAVELTLQGQKQPIAGAVWITADTETDLESRTVTLDDIEVEKMSFAVLDTDLSSAAEKAVKSMISRKPLTVALDRILAGLRQTELTSAKNVELKNEPPKIIVSIEPARLLIFDGQPMFTKIEGTNLRYAINTNWTVLNEEATSNYYLLDGTTWLFTNKLGDPWKLAKSLPGDLASLPADDNFKDARDNAQGRHPQYSKPPTIFMMTEPAELIVFDGKPKYKDAGPEDLYYAVNTEADLFYYRKDKSWYFLVAGRWYRATESLEGPWSFATADLPTVFSLIPSQGPKGRVLYSVPGTPQAQESVRAAGIPQTATVKPGDVKLTIAYAGEPEFEPITGTTPPLLYAVNASVAVIKVSDTAYYACDRGIWFAAPAPTGPWVVASTVPQAIYTIPPSSPLYPVTYVVQYEQSPEVVVSSYTSGYTGCYVSFGVSFWGTGYYYPPYWHYPPHGYPIYYPRPYTWGAHAWYNPATSTYYRGGSAYGPYGGFGAGAAYNAATGTYKRGYGAYGPAGGYKVGQAYNSRTGAWATGAAAYGPNGSIRAAQGYNPSTGTRFAGAQGSSVYGSWGTGVVSRGDQWVKGGYASTGQGTVGGIRTSEGGSVIKGQNNTYVGKDGNVYRKNESGWQKYENGAWSSADRSRGNTASQLPAQPGSPQQGALGDRASSKDVTHDLNRESANRSAGEQRTNQWNHEYSQRSAAQPAQRSAAPAGGGMRGGGGGGGRR